MTQSIWLKFTSDRNRAAHLIKKWRKKYYELKRRIKHGLV